MFYFFEKIKIWAVGGSLISPVFVVIQPYMRLELYGLPSNLISKVILSHGDNDINLDFADVKTVMSHRGLALMGAGYSTGTNAAYDAAKAAIESPLLDNISIDGAMGVLVHFDIHPDYPIMEIGEAMSIVEESADEDASVILNQIKNNWAAFKNLSSVQCTCNT